MCKCLGIDGRLNSTQFISSSIQSSLPTKKDIEILWRRKQFNNQNKKESVWPNQKKNYMRTKNNSRSSASGRIDGRENEKSMIVVYLYYIDGWNIGNKLKSIQEALLLQHTLILNNLRSNKWIFIILISLSIVINLYHSFLLLRRQRQTRRKEKKKRARVKEWSKKILKRQHQLVVWKINHWFVMNIKRSLKQQLRTQNKKLKRNQPNNSDLVHLRIKKHEYHVMINKLSARN